MKHFQIASARDGHILYEGQFPRFKTCLEQAVHDRADLSWADLSGHNLSNATLDDALLNHADFKGCNLTGANLSESKLYGASFINADLYNTCFAWSDLRASRFEDASFGATDITGCDLSFAVFSTLSCFSLDFIFAKAMKECSFVNADGLVAAMSQPPVVIKGMSCNMVIFMDNCVKIGPDLVDYKDGIALLRKTGRLN